MAIVSLDDARMHTKSDGDDDELLEKYLSYAMGICQRYINRQVFETHEELAAEVATLSDRVAAAYADYDVAIEDAEDIESGGDLRTGAWTRRAAQRKLDAELAAVEMISAGFVPPNEFAAAVLMTVGHLYKNRSDVVVGQYSGVQMLPLGSRAILAPMIWNGGSIDV